MNICETRDHGEIVHEGKTCPACEAIEILKEKLAGVTDERDEYLREIRALEAL